MSFCDTAPACEWIDSQTGEEKKCLQSECRECVLVQLFCEDCKKYDECIYRGKPKITSSNRHALSMYSFACKFNWLPQAGGTYDQPIKLIRQFEIIMDEVVKQEKIQERIEKNKMVNHANFY